MAKSPDEMAASMVQNLKEKTGKTLEQWFTVVQKKGSSEQLVGESGC